MSERILEASKMDTGGAWNQISPVLQRRLDDEVHEALARLIRSGEMKNGQRLPSEEELCRRFQVSRPVVRSALRRLRDEQLIVSRKGSGSYVAIDNWDSDQQLAEATELRTRLYALEFRRSIEPDVAYYAAIRRGSAEMQALSDALDAFRAGPDGGPLPRADFLFHQAIAEASRNDHYLRALDLIGYDIDTGITLAEHLSRIGQAERREAIFTEHQAIHDAIRRQRPEEASAAMQRHLDHAQARVIARGDVIRRASPAR